MTFPDLVLSVVSDSQYSTIGQNDASNKIETKSVAEALLQKKMDERKKAVVDKGPSSSSQQQEETEIESNDNALTQKERDDTTKEETEIESNDDALTQKERDDTTKEIVSSVVEATASISEYFALEHPVLMIIV